MQKLSQIKKLPKVDYIVKNTRLHDSALYTQGLHIYNGLLIESSGRYGHSKVNVLNLETNAEERKWDLQPNEFAEGVSVCDGIIYVFTWKNQLCYQLDLEELEVIGRIPIDGERWGSFADESNIYVSNGTNIIEAREKYTLARKFEIGISISGQNAIGINDFVIMDQFVIANVWKRSFLMIAEKDSGRVIGIADLSSIAPLTKFSRSFPYMNGIALLNAKNCVLITGKYWDFYYELEFLF